MRGEGDILAAEWWGEAILAADNGEGKGAKNRFPLTKHTGHQLLSRGKVEVMRGDVFDQNMSISVKIRSQKGQIWPQIFFEVKVHTICFEMAQKLWGPPPVVMLFSTLLNVSHLNFWPKSVHFG